MSFKLNKSTYSLSTFFQKIDGKSSWRVEVVLIDQPINAPKNLNISRWLGLLAEGLGIQHSLY